MNVRNCVSRSRNLGMCKFQISDEFHARDFCMVYRRDHKMFEYRDGKFSDHSKSFSCSQTNFRRFHLVSWQNCVLFKLAGSELKVESASLQAAINFFTTHRNIICSVAPEVCRSFRDFIMPNLASNNWNWCFSIQQAETVSTTILCCAVCNLSISRAKRSQCMWLDFHFSRLKQN